MSSGSGEDRDRIGLYVPFYDHGVVGEEGREQVEKNKHDNSSCGRAKSAPQ